MRAAPRKTLTTQLQPLLLQCPDLQLGQNRWFPLRLAQPPFPPAHCRGPRGQDHGGPHRPGPWQRLGSRAGEPQVGLGVLQDDGKVGAARPQEAGRHLPRSQRNGCSTHQFMDRADGCPGPPGKALRLHTCRPLVHQTVWMWDPWCTRPDQM